MVYDVALLTMCWGFWGLAYWLWRAAPHSPGIQVSVWHVLAVASWAASLMLFCLLVEWIPLAVGLFSLFTIIMLG
jgi:hypothetical protein